MIRLTDRETPVSCIMNHPQSAMLGFSSAARERKGLKACDALDLAMWGCDIHLAFGCCRAAAMTSTWQHSEHSSSAHLAGLPALATAAAAAEEVPEGPSDQPEPSDQQQQGKGGVQAQRVDSNAQSDPIEPQPTPFEAFTQAPLSSEKPEAGAAKAKSPGARHNVFNGVQRHGHVHAVCHTHAC